MATQTQLEPNGTNPALNVRREMQSWRRLALDPVTLRGSDHIDNIDEEISPEGAHLTAMIYRLAHQMYDGNPPDPEGFYASLAVRLAEFVSLRSLYVERHKDDSLSIEAEMLRGGTFPARSLSDGTLRLIALAALSFMRNQRLLCIEEPENGIHPSSMPALVDLIRELATVPEIDLEYEQTLRQVIVNTHSPDFVRAVYEDSDDAILMATPTMITGPFGEGARVLRLEPLVDTWRSSPDRPGTGLLPLLAYLGADTPPRG